MPTIMPQQMSDAVIAALGQRHVGEGQAMSVASALVKAEIDGKKGHGLARVPSYAAQAKTGKVDGNAMPSCRVIKPGVLGIDAGHGFAYPAFDLMMENLPEMARRQGIAMAGVQRSHHYGVAGHHVERAADLGLIAILLGNTPAAMAPWGGKTPIFGTNPIAFAAPVMDDVPVVIDLATSKVARGNIMTAHQKGNAIPEGWALDADGQPTTDPAAALKGSMVPLGDAKGAALALMIEVLAAGLTGASFGHQATSFFDADGAPPNVGQVMIMIDPEIMVNNFSERLADLARLIVDDGSRMPGSGRVAKRDAASINGVVVDDALWQTIIEMGQE